MRILFVALTVFFSFISVSYAGFEWVPPKNMPAPTITPQRAVMAPPPVARVPLAPVTRTPVVPPIASMPAPLNAPSAASPQMQMKRPTGSGLYINPYPLRNPNPEKVYRQMNAASIDQAMIESAGIMNPVKLGNGMASSAKISPPAPFLSNKSPSVLQPRSPASLRPSSMTPMQGGEPAPLNRAGLPTKNSYAEAVGFGRDLPLALALSQIIPNDYSHSFSGNIDAGTIVSWQGGKPWDQALNDMLRSKNMRATIQGRQVIIQ